MKFRGLASQVTPRRLLPGWNRLVRRSVRPRSSIEIARHRCLDIRVGEQTVDRAIRIVDTLIKALESRGDSVEISGPKMIKPMRAWERPSLNRNKTRVLINGEYVEFAIEEGHDTVAVDLTKDPYYGTLRFKSRPSREHRYNGRLLFRIGNAPAGRGVQHNWSDGKIRRIETQLNSIVRGLIGAADAIRAKRLDRERWRREFEENQRRREEERLLREREAQRVTDLTSRLAAWKESRAILEFVAVVEKENRERVEDVASDAGLVGWITWARQRAEQLAASAIQTIIQAHTQHEEGRSPSSFRTSTDYANTGIQRHE